jgi:hypothetical protein
MAQLWRFGPLPPGIHIAQFPFQVIGNCGVISLMQRSNRDKVKIPASSDDAPTRIEVPTVNVRLSRELHPQLSVGAVHNMTVSWRGGLAGIFGTARG